MADNKEDKPETKHDKKNKKKKKEKKEKEVRKKLDIGHVVQTVADAYKVESVLGSGGFGDVYQVYPSKKPNKKYAMKTEYFDAQKRKLLNRLKVEMAVFADIQKCASPIDKSHFVHYIDKGKTEVFKFIIMEIVSYSLIDIRTNMMKGITSFSTTIQIGRQTLQSIEALHYIGYVHRDIKPHNFAIGLPPLDNKIYMLDFGIARKFCDTERRVRIPRKVVRFLGTVKYASRACHNEKEQCRRDDIEVWCYMMLEYFNKENLRWRRKTDRGQIVALKNDLMTNYRTLDPKLLMPKKFNRVMDLIECMTYTCIPDFAALHKTLDDICKDENIDETQPLDWIGKKMEKVEAGKAKKTKADEKLLNCDDTEDRKNWDARDKRKREGAEKKRKLEEELARIYKELDESKTPAEIRAEIRSRMRKEKRRRAQDRRDEDEDEEGEDSEDDYSDEEDEPRRRSKMLSVMKQLRDDPSRASKIESRRKRTGKRHSREDPDEDVDKRDGPSGHRRKGSRHSQYGSGSRVDKMESHKRKRQSKMDKPPPESPSVSVKMRSVNDYIVFKTANDASMEKDADAKDKEVADKKASLMKKPDKEKNSQ